MWLLLCRLQDSTLRGFTIWYPDQVGGEVPAPYPWTISMQENNPAVHSAPFRAIGNEEEHLMCAWSWYALVDQVLDVELLNSFNGIAASTYCAVECRVSRVFLRLL